RTNGTSGLAASVSASRTSPSRSSGWLPRNLSVRCRFGSGTQATAPQSGRRRSISAATARRQSSSRESATKARTAGRRSARRGGPSSEGAPQEIQRRLRGLPLDGVAAAREAEVAHLDGRNRAGRGRRGAADEDGADGLGG